MKPGNGIDSIHIEVHALAVNDVSVPIPLATDGPWKEEVHNKELSLAIDPAASMIPLPLMYQSVLTNTTISWTNEILSSTPIVYRLEKLPSDGLVRPLGIREYQMGGREGVKNCSNLMRPRERELGRNSQNILEETLE